MSGDIGDRAEAREAIQREEALFRARQAITPAAASKLFCVECEERIPNERRVAVPGCLRCVDCQEFFEKTGHQK
jgi:phage/conjugal plasmid C-4 type zinc finger TraR family protein